MSGYAENLLGRRFGKLVVLEKINTHKVTSRSAWWKCQCDCGNITEVAARHLKAKLKPKTDCGCVKGYSKSGTYISYRSMRNRCLNKNSPDYPKYGGRGITVCGRWLDSFENFSKDMGPRPIGTTLDRKDKLGNYEPSNCKWSTYHEQTLNRSTSLISKEELDRLNKTLGFVK
ncbi:MAG: hypothetical protein WC444_06385 [Candidatus Paceibacterota bacterium]